MPHRQRIRDVQVAEEIAAQAGTEGTPDIFLSDLLQPVIFGPQRPPLATSGYYPGVLGVNTAAVALNTSHAGLFVPRASNIIVRVNRIGIVTAGAAVIGYDIRRQDVSTGFILGALVPGYINAANPGAGAVFRMQKSDAVAASGTFMAQMIVEAETVEWIDGPWILNDGGVTVSPVVVNTAVRIFANYEVWPSIRPQPVPG